MRFSLQFIFCTCTCSLSIVQRQHHGLRSRHHDSRWERARRVYFQPGQHCRQQWGQLVRVSGRRSTDSTGDFPRSVRANLLGQTSAFPRRIYQRHHDLWPLQPAWDSEQRHGAHRGRASDRRRPRRPRQRSVFPQPRGHRGGCQWASLRSGCRVVPGATADVCKSGIVGGWPRNAFKKKSCF